MSKLTNTNIGTHNQLVASITDFDPTDYIPKVHYQNIYIPAAAMTPHTTDGADFETVEFATDKLNRDYLLVPGTGHAADGFAGFSIILPESWDGNDVSGHTLRAKFEWAPTTDSTGNIKLGLRGRCFADSADLDVAMGGTIWIEDALGATPSEDRDQISIATAAISLTDYGVGRIVSLQALRDDASVSNYTGDIRLYGIYVQYKNSTVVTSAW